MAENRRRARAIDARDAYPIALLSAREPNPTDSVMSRVCQVTGKGTRAGGRIARRGLAKAKGGVGLNTTGHTKRKFKINTQKKRIWVPELKQYVTVRLSTRALKAINKRGAFPVLHEAGLIKPKSAAK